MAASLSIAAVRSRQICLGLFLVSFVSYLLFSHLVPITDPVESNYVLTAKEMVKSGDWISPQIYGHVWFDKPIFFYWLTALAFKWFGVSDLAARLAPALFAGLGVVLIYWFLNKTSSQAVALLSALVMGTSLEYVLLAKFVITDMVLFVFNSAALVFFYLGYTKVEGFKRWYLLMYASMALAVLTKGPVGLLLPGFVMAIFIAVQRNWAELRKMSIPTGLVLFVVIAFPWYIVMYYVHGSEFIDTFLGVHNYLRATVSEHPKDNVFYYYLVVFLLSMLPWAPLALKAMVATWKDQSLRKSPLWLFSFIWMGVYFIFYSLMATKYLTYTFPTLFPLAMLTGNYLEQSLIQDKKNTIIYWVAIPMIVSTLAYIVAIQSYLENLWIVVASLMLIIVFVWREIKEQRPKYILELLCIYQVAVYMMLSFFILPAMADTRSEKELAQDLLNYSDSHLGLYEFYSTSAVYYSGKTAVKLTSSEPVVSPQTELSWSSKYTMPTESLVNFVTNSKKNSIVIIVPEQKRKQFLEEIKNSNPQLLKTTDRFSYYHFGD
ncbi:Undecaprenyl phosphate-alpha-4-amino-4-deoxy-L-arabinose arabinosyl transferase [Sporomusa ovata DSM 2662]|uniref:Polymyxin resistance protein ArnT, undecaprenyl phosphate-alpha-L-Ara4N transferase Melittin resistance protein PqaB n=1 Tax=Sporomusa ovata TaxID=2378 RepID=A0A0U1KWQ8_9FIRM|nr:glycosyltransferase family 39 protein [Sporomusa ovata]EQB28722.1 undecaprenyl phosphate-alpha-4-amino-4-deoxy-L-arabinose arabinosyl transferase [Sporomusa ovata DSM 2662]CQR71872.1 Polymyxin resistance protein ArnT, undecaprenyl phosphate-alpha-L-Ara4N transferase; Melittin resistance protein PqaB [Sporomusa ovata]